MKFPKLLALMLSLLLSLSCTEKGEVDDSTLCTVTFETNKGTEIDPIKVEKGTKIEAPQNPEREDCTFLGWYSDEALTLEWSFDVYAVSKDMTLYAAWQINPGAGVTITFVTNGGSEIEPVEIIAGETITKPADPEKAKFRFAAWYSDEELTQKWDFDTAVSEAMTLYAAWEEAKREISISYLGEALLSTSGFHAEGEKNVDWFYGGHMTPSGDCVKVLNGYIFYAWWEGLASDKNKCELRLSRKPVNGDASTWRTVEFDWKHVGLSGQIFNGTGHVVDSHNTIAVGVCPIDGTIHMVYDLHCHTKNTAPGYFFNYTASKAGVAFGSDEEFAKRENYIDRQDHMNAQDSFDGLTYPNFLKTDNGELVIVMRSGGSTAGNHFYSQYNGAGTWAPRAYYNIGYFHTPGKPETYLDDYNLYGTWKYVNGHLIHVSHMRPYANHNDNTGQLNIGLYYGSIRDPFGSPKIIDAAGGEHDMPVEKNIAELKIADPELMGYGERISSSPAWTASERGDIHAITSMSGNKYIHYWKPAGATEFKSSLNAPYAGSLYCIDNKIINVGIRNRLKISVCDAGQDNWTEVYAGVACDLCESDFDPETGIIAVCTMTYDGDGNKKDPISVLTFNVYKYL